MSENKTINEVKIVLTVEHNGTIYTETSTRFSEPACWHHRNIGWLSREMAENILRQIDKKEAGNG